MSCRTVVESPRCYGLGAEWQTVEEECSLIPRPPLFFVLWFAFSIIHRSGRAAGRPGNEARKNVCSNLSTKVKTIFYLVFVGEIDLWTHQSNVQVIVDEAETRGRYVEQ